jgi:hypothetical protein
MLTHILGFIGMGLILGAYSLNVLGKTTPKSNAYRRANLLGSLILLWYSIVLQAWANVGINAFWVVVTLLAYLKSKPPN